MFRQPRKLSRAFRTSTSPRGAFALLAVLLVSLVIVAPGDGYPAASAGQWSAGFEPYPCDSMAYGEEAKLDYMTELFERMVRTDRNVASSSEGQAQWERIIAIEKQSEWICVCVCVCVGCLLYTSPSPRDISGSRMPSSA